MDTPDLSPGSVNIAERQAPRFSAGLVDIAERESPVLQHGDAEKRISMKWNTELVAV